ncbi:formyltransferase family protein [Paralcaligenes ginsengisoli]
MSTMLILGSDKVAGSVFTLPELSATNPVIVRDESTNLHRVARLMWKGRLSALLLLKMFFCECQRSNTRNVPASVQRIKNNKDLLTLLNKHQPNRVILFRAGLVINKEVISYEIPLLNIHCAKIPEFGGLGSIARALRNGVMDQSATLHQVTTTIDSGTVFDTEPFTLDPNLSYCANERIAYNAGLRLLQRTLRSDIGMKK